MIIVPPTITPRTRPQLADFVIASIEAAGVPVRASSRLRKIHQLYHSGLGIIGRDHPDYEMALEGDRDLQLLGFVFDQCPTSDVPAPYRERLEKVVDDSVLPQHNRSNSPGRDAGFELYVGAVCKAAQLLPVAWGETDVTCVWNDVRYAFEAKRLKSIKKLTTRVKEAVDQIDRSGLPGVIVLDLASAFNPDNHRIRRMPDTIFWSEYEENFRITWSRYQAKVQQLIASANVLGIVVHDYHIRQIAQDWQLTGMTIRVPAVARTVEEQRHFDELSTLYTYGLPNQDNVSNLPLVLP